MLKDIVTRSYESIDDLITDLAVEVENENANIERISELENQISELEREVETVRETNMNLLGRLANATNKSDYLEKEVENLYDEKEVLNEIIDEMSKEY